MKHLLAIVLFMSNMIFVNAQTFDEWFRQKKTRIQYLEQQVLSLQLFNMTLEEGYEIAGDGLNLIHGIKTGDWDQHNTYFGSLLTPSATALSGKTEYIRMRYEEINRLLRTVNGLRGSPWIRPGEADYIEAVDASLAQKCAEDINTLDNLMSRGAAAMKEEDRLTAISLVAQRIEDRYQFLADFKSKTGQLIAARTKEWENITSVQDFYHLK